MTVSTGSSARCISIDDRVAGINNRAATVIDAAAGIKDNLGTVRNDVLPDIVKNSAAIAGSPLLDPVALAANPLMAGLQAPLLLGPITEPLVVGPPELPAAAAGPLDAALVPEAPVLLGPDAGADTSPSQPRDRARRRRLAPPARWSARRCTG